MFGTGDKCNIWIFKQNESALPPLVSKVTDHEFAVNDDLAFTETLHPSLTLEWQIFCISCSSFRHATIQEND